MTIFTEPKQYQVEPLDSGQSLLVPGGRFFGPQLGGDKMNLFWRYGDVIQPYLRGHSAVALGMVLRKAAVIADIHIP